MGSLSERDPNDPDLDYSPLRLSERAAKLGPFVSQRARSEALKSSLTSRPESLAPKVINEPVRRTRDLERRAALLGVAARIAAVAVAVAAVAMLFVIMKPAPRHSLASSTPSDTTGSTPQSNQEGVDSKPPVAQEESQQLLRRFLQWREKANIDRNTSTAERKALWGSRSAELNEWDRDRRQAVKRLGSSSE